MYETFLLENQILIPGRHGSQPWVPRQTQSCMSGPLIPPSQTPLCQHLVVHQSVGPHFPRFLGLLDACACRFGTCHMHHSCIRTGVHIHRCHRIGTGTHNRPQHRPRRGWETRCIASVRPLQAEVLLLGSYILPFWCCSRLLSWFCGFPWSSFENGSLSLGVPEPASGPLATSFCREHQGANEAPGLWNFVALCLSSNGGRTEKRDYRVINSLCHKFHTLLSLTIKLISHNKLCILNHWLPQQPSLYVERSNCSIGPYVLRIVIIYGWGKYTKPYQFFGVATDPLRP